MDKSQALDQMIAPGQKRRGKPLGGVIQIWVTRACDKACFGCTQGGNLRGFTGIISLSHFEGACVSLKDYFGVVGVFGGNPTTHPQFRDLCEILARHIPFRRRGLWSSHPMGHGKVCQRTFNPAVSNLNVHLDEKAYREFKRDWPNARPFGLKQDSRHSPPYVAMQDLVLDAEKRWELIANCDINQHWSAMICVVREKLRGFFCEIAGAQAMLHQSELGYPDFGVPIESGWWNRPIGDFVNQVQFHCHACGVPLRGRGELACATDGVEQTTETHRAIYKPKLLGREVQVVTSVEDLGHVNKATDYLGNAKR